MQEVYTQLYDHPYYQISNLGNVRSLERKQTDSLGRPLTRRGQPIATRTNKVDDHLFFETYYTDNDSGIRVRKTIHVAVAVAHHFLPPPKKNHCYVIHKDGNKANNQVSNLKWATHKQVFYKQYQKKS